MKFFNWLKIDQELHNCRQSFTPLKWLKERLMWRQCFSGNNGGRCFSKHKYKLEQIPKKFENIMKLCTQPTHMGSQFLKICSSFMSIKLPDSFEQSLKSYVYFTVATKNTIKYWTFSSSFSKELRTIRQLAVWTLDVQIMGTCLMNGFCLRSKRTCKAFIYRCGPIEKPVDSCQYVSSIKCGSLSLQKDLPSWFYLDRLFIFSQDTK